MECGIRIKYRPVQRDRRPHRHEGMEELARWCRTFDEEGMAPVEGGASAGNLSFRTLTGFVITPTRTHLKSELSWDRFAEVVRSNWLDYEVHYLGTAPPSSDVFLHDRIYRARPDVQAVFHGHDDVVLAQAGTLGREFDIVVTPREIEFGTREDAEETARTLGARDYLIRRGHGFLSVGRTMAEAGERAVKIHRRAVECARS
jgi:ribulose-5-phosphate 4-epimerase/fuculose-1-phosphate aldolase